MTWWGHTVECRAWPYQLELAVDVELPPVQVVDVEGEVVVPTAAGVGENVPAALGKAQEDMSGGAESRWARLGSTHHPTQLPHCPAVASPCIEEVLIHDAFKGDTDSGWQLPEEARGELPTDLEKGWSGLLRHRWAEATCGPPVPSPKVEQCCTQAYSLPTIKIKGGPSSGRWIG